MSNFASSPLFNIVGYILLLFALMFVVKAEMTDIRCPNPNCPKDECADYGKGMAYFGSTPSEQDSVPQLLDKILIASKTEERTVKWRRCFILSFLIITAIWILVLQKVPSVVVFVLMLFIAMAVWHFSFGYYAFHHYQAAVDNIDEAVGILREKTEKCNE
uniref:Membrane protein n=1 Tax=Marseillevirus sp. TaxID=2809551 RepID=A0AA96IY40_9VIRU|nr:membrane protein [Marseillevirus sp.]